MPISGKELLRQARRDGWELVSQKGSHMKVRKRSKTAIIPNHRELKKGLERALRKQLGL